MKEETNSDLLMRQYELLVDLYKHYLEMVLKFNIFHYAVTGAILAFYFKERGAGPVGGLLRFSLVFPLVMSLAMGLFFVWASTLIPPMRQEVAAVGNRLGFAVKPEIKVLEWLLRIFALLYFLTAVGLGVALFSG